MNDKTKPALTLKDVMIAAAVCDVAVAAGSSYKAATSQQLLQLAKTFDDAKLFAKACEDIEKFVKSDAGRVEVEQAITREGFKGVTFDGAKLPKTWAQAKSNILVAWGKFRMDIKSYDTESAMRKALNAKRQAAKGGENPIAKVYTVKCTDTLRQSIAYLLMHAAKLPETEQDKAAKAITKQAKEYEALARTLVPKTVKAKDAKRTRTETKASEAPIKARRPAQPSQPQQQAA